MTAAPAAVEGLVLDVPGGLPADPLRRFLAAHAVPGAERHDAATGTHERLVPTSAGPAPVAVVLGAAQRCERVPVRVLEPVPGEVVGEVVGEVRRWLDLDGAVAAAEEHLRTDPELAPLVAARPGLRVPRTVSGAETALLTVLGQQVSLAAARTFAGRLAAAFGRPAGAGLTAFPAPAVLAAAGPDALRAATGVTGARARALHALAELLAGGLDLDAARAAGEGAAARARLLAVPGVGPWTADLVALRALGDDDAFLPGDLVLRRAMGSPPPAGALARAEGWRPWRGYALLHLWTRAVFTDPAPSR
ncbi:3-methyladenine DNA glycosylase 2 [Kineococcus sp. TRM81007]|nr:AlkA N-terminal domain-containing protein [Kineococcus sp. TRM81007]MCI2237415.1 3-methyladenine DNA glycosylase 2 [Kineococcus sp. TRM81007]